MRRTVSVVLIGWSMGCVGAPHFRPRASATPPEEELPQAIRLRIANVQVDSDDTDPSPTPVTSNLFCRLLGEVGRVGGGIAGGYAMGPQGVAVGGAVGGNLETVCSSVISKDEPPAARRTEAPDLSVALKIGAQHFYRSPTHYNSYSIESGHSFLIPVRDLGPEGIFLSVDDEDAGGRFKQIGSFRLTREELLSLRGKGLQRLAEKDGRNAGDLEVVVEDWQPVDVVVDVPAAKGTMAAALDVPAGAVVQVTATGSYRLSQRTSDLAVGPSGQPATAGHTGNYPEIPLARANHGAAFAAVGDGDKATFFLVPSCAKLLGAEAGFVIVGINDARNTADNSGTTTFHIQIMAPHDGEWGASAHTTACELGPPAVQAQTVQAR